MIEAQGLTRTYGALTAIDGLTFQVGKGEVVGFLGPNGAGKTTTMRILVGALAATSGTARVAGLDVSVDPLGVKRMVGYLPERPPVYADMTVRDYVHHAAILKGVARPGRAVDEALDKADLVAVASRRIGHLSKGFRQRVGLAQALVHAPRVLVLDEPASGLDPAQRVAMRQLVRRLADTDATVILSTHVLAEVEALCDRVLVVVSGRLVLQGRMDELAAQRPLRLRVDRPEGLAEALRALAGVQRVESLDDGSFTVQVDAEHTPEVARVAAGHDLRELVRLGGLEEAYLQATRGVP